MKRLRGVLQSYSKPITLGGDPTPGALGFSAERLTADLQAVSRSNEYYFGICVVMVVALFLVMLLVVTRSLTSPDTVKVAIGAFGLSGAGIVRLMIGLWREKVATDVLITLSTTIERELLRSIVEVL